MTDRVVANRAILRLAIPALGTLAIDPLLTLADTAFVARLGVGELAALGVDTALLGFAFFGFNFLAYATTPLVAQALGRGDRSQARRWVGDALILAVGLGVLAAICIELLAPRLVGLMGASGEVAHLAVSYLRLRVLATPAVLLVTAGHGAFRGHQDMKTPLRVALGVNLINLALDPILIFGFGFGIQGAALATVVAQVIGALWFVRLLRSRDMADRPAAFRKAIPTILALARNGALVSLRTGALLLGLTYAAATATRLGDTQIAAHQVVMQVWLLAAMVSDSFAIAAQAMVGDVAGGGSNSQLNALVSKLLVFGLGTGVLLLVAFVAGGPAIGVLVDDPVTAELAVSAARVAGWMMPVATLVFVGDGIFFGLLAFGTVVASTTAGATTLVGLVALTTLGQSLDGIWWAIGAMLVARGVVFVLGYRRSIRVVVRS
ncbi:MAG: MATE family efflux transporter [Acidimicrobiia bacterium]